MQSIVQERNLKVDSSPLAMYNFFVERIRRNLHVVLTMSPIGDAFRNRLRMFPSLINCCTIDWFQVRNVMCSRRFGWYSRTVDLCVQMTVNKCKWFVRVCIFVHLTIILQGLVVRRWVKFNPGLGETLNIIPSSRNKSGLSKLLLKNTPRKAKYVNPKWQPKSIFKEVNQIAG